MFSKLLLLALGVSACAGELSSGQSVSGVIVGPGGRLDRLRLDAVSDVSHQSEATAWASADGEFEFRSLPHGSYQIRVSNVVGEVLASTTFDIPSSRPLRLALPSLGQRAAPSPVSAYRLGHKVPAKAQKAYRKATETLRAGDRAAAAALYDKAIEADPDFADALHMRGLYAFENQDFTLAGRLLGQAARLDGANAAFQADAASAVYATNAFADAERYARSALRLDPASPRAHFVLGLSLLRLGRPRQQALDALRPAAGAIPSAALLVARLSAQ